MMMLLLILRALWFIAPAYAANAFPPLVRGTKPLDFGRKLNKNRILGDGKTFEGTIAGIMFGTAFGSFLIYIQSFIPTEWNLGLNTMTFPLVALLSIGAIAGDIIGAFLKRRMGIPRGQPAPPLDQLDFLLFAILLVLPVYNPGGEIFVVLIFLTPAVHWVANLIGYFCGVKKTPW